MKISRIHPKFQIKEVGGMIFQQKWKKPKGIKFLYVKFHTFLIFYYPANHLRVVALYRYESKSDGDLGIEKGDIMMLLDRSYDSI